MDSKQEGRPLPAYFPPSNSAKDTFQKNENIFSKKNYLQQILITFPNLKFLWFLQKTLNSGANNIFI